VFIRATAGGGIEISDRVPGDLRRDIAELTRPMSLGRDVRQAGLLTEPPGSGFESVRH